MANLLLDVSQVPAKLVDVSRCRRTLLAFDNDGYPIPIDEEDVKPRAVLEHAFTKALVWVRKQPVL